MYSETNPETAIRWQQADARKPGTPGYAGDQANLRGWIDGEIQGAIERGELDPSDPTAFQSFLATLGVTDEKGGGRFLFREYTQRGAGAKFAGMAPGQPAGGGALPMARDMGRQALMSQYGGGLSGSSSRPSPGSWADWGNWR